MITSSAFESTTLLSLALIDVVDSIYSHLDLDEIVMGIYVDLHKAFDTVNHDILLYKLYIMEYVVACSLDLKLI